MGKREYFRRVISAWVGWLRSSGWKVLIAGVLIDGLKAGIIYCLLSDEQAAEDEVPVLLAGIILAIGILLGGLLILAPYRVNSETCRELEEQRELERVPRDDFLAAKHCLSKLSEDARRLSTGIVLDDVTAWAHTCGDFLEDALGWHKTIRTILTEYHRRENYRSAEWMLRDIEEPLNNLHSGLQPHHVRSAFNGFKWRKRLGG